MPFLDDFAPAAANTLLGTGLGLALQRHNDQRQYDQQMKLQGLQMWGQKQMMDYSYQKQLQMWKDTNYAAQLREMKAAGLSPGLMYGMKGGGGVTTGNPTANVQGAQAPMGGNEVLNSIGMGLNLALLKAQKENIEADTKEKEARATKTSGIDTAVGEQTLNNLIQDIQNKKAQEAWTNIQTRIDEIKERVAYITENSAIEQISALSRQAMAEARMAEVRKHVTEETATDLIKTVHEQLIKIGLEQALIDAQTTTEKGKPAVQKAEIFNLQEQANGIIRQGVQRWEEIYYKGIQTLSENDKREHDKWVHDIADSMKLPIDVVEKVVQAVLIKDFLRAKPTPNPTRGFHDRSE